MPIGFSIQAKLPVTKKVEQWDEDDDCYFYYLTGFTDDHFVAIAFSYNGQLLLVPQDPQESFSEALHTCNNATKTMQRVENLFSHFDFSIPGIPVTFTLSPWYDKYHDF